MKIKDLTEGKPKGTSQITIGNRPRGRPASAEEIASRTSPADKQHRIKHYSKTGYLYKGAVPMSKAEADAIGAEYADKTKKAKVTTGPKVEPGSTWEKYLKRMMKLAGAVAGKTPVGKVVRAGTKLIKQ